MKGFALLFGIVFLAIGIAGFIPGVTVAHDHPDVAVRSGLGLVLGLFPVNVVHNVVHIAFGAWGLGASRSWTAARAYARVVAVVYALLTVMGLVDAGNLHTTFGLVPLYGHDIWLHALLAAVAAYFGWAHRDERASGHAAV